MSFARHAIRRWRRDRLPPWCWVVTSSLGTLLREGPGPGWRELRGGLQRLDGWRTAKLEPVGEPFRLPRAETPRVSVIVVAHDRWRHTCNCLHSIAMAGSNVPFEVVVVDNGSNDETARFLRELEGAVVVSLAENAGFVMGTNAGLCAASGEEILLLNNDTIVTPTWLDALVAAFDRDSTIGVVGPRLLFPNGRLQECGSAIVGTSSLNIGKFDDPTRALWAGPRDVDYVSGAALLVRGSLLRDLGGLDERFSPGFWEDADLCFAARERGWRVICDPASTVFHFEGTSSWRDVSAGGQWTPRSNAERFFEKWGANPERPSTPGV